MTVSQSERAKQFRALHDGPGTFVIPNPWDVGTTRMLAALGFQALATTSAGFAFSLGRRGRREFELPLFADGRPVALD